MKKILSILTLVCFVAINVSLAQTAPKAEAEVKATKTEAAAKADDNAGMPACCKKASKGCSKEAMKNCSPKEKADCEKGGEKTEASKKETKSGTN